MCNISLDQNAEKCRPWFSQTLEKIMLMICLNAFISIVPNTQVNTKWELNVMVTRRKLVKKISAQKQNTEHADIESHLQCIKIKKNIFQIVTTF